MSNHDVPARPADGATRRPAPPPQAQVEAAITRVIDAVVPRIPRDGERGRALKGADEIGRGDPVQRHKGKPA